MIRTIVSIFITLGLLIATSWYESNHVKNTFSAFDNALTVLYDKTEAGEVTYEDGTAVESFWENQKNTLHIWLPHSALTEIDYQLYEAVGYLYVCDYKSALPKIEILRGMCKNIPQSYRFSIENIL